MAQGDSPQTLIRWKALVHSPCSKYAEHRDGKPNAAVNGRQRQVDKDYHHRAKELDSGLDGDSSDGFEAELSSYGKRGKVLGPVVGA